MKETDQELLNRMYEVEDFKALCETFDRDGIEYDELEMAKQYEMIHNPFAEAEPEY